MDTPELDKLTKIQSQSQMIGEFLEWLESKEMWIGASDGDYEAGPVSQTREQLLAEYFGIDLKKVEQEKRQIIEELRRNT